MVNETLRPQAPQGPKRRRRSGTAPIRSLSRPAAGDVPGGFPVYRG
jgi:hypothetical protein